jgi:predicted CXXCH cytochrome family protein
MKRLVLGIILILLIMGTPDIVQVRVTGECSNCHTMHYSQGGGQLSEWGSSGPYKALTIDTCLGCHTGTNTGSNTVPYVFSTTEPTYGGNTLAGGNFFWVGQGDDAKGHNVLGIAGDDQKLGEAPGNPNRCGNSCHYSLATESYNSPGCCGCHMNPAHHADDSAAVVGTADNSTDGYYRFLSGHMSGSTHGVCGIEDDDWQYTKNATDHNEYMGYSGDKRYDAGFYNLGHTMTAFCSGCHGDFHEEHDWGSNWVRHPSDAVIPDSGEYASAFGASSGTGTYDPLVPVARPSSLSGWTGPSSSVTLGTGGDMVMCLSCHRAHGSPYYKMMRWDYKNWPGEGTNGCGVCHTSKN